MKKKMLLIISIMIIVIAVIFVDKLSFTNNNIENGFNDLSQIKHVNTLSMMLEQNAGAGDYSLETRSTWPTKDDGYVFNSTLSKCENDSTLSWDEENSVILMVGNTSDKCYVYFDVYVEPPYHESCNDNTLACYVAKQYTGTQGVNNLYYHDSTLANGAGDNSYRYAGASDTTNNFVCFGSDAATCPDDNLYRIIGVFGDKVKLIKWDYATTALLGNDGDSNGACSANSDCVYGINNNYYKGSNTAANIGAYWWNYDGTTYGTNTWSASELNTVNLNKNFLNNIGTTWSNKIATTTWIVGGNTWGNIGDTTAANAYKNEYTNPAESTTVNAKIGLMYTSDYGFAAAPSAWTTTLYNYYSNDASGNKITDENWMYMGLLEWTVVCRSDDPDDAFYVYSAGNVNSYVVGLSSHAYAVRPVFHLESFVTYGSGLGTKENPVIIN